MKSINIALKPFYGNLFLRNKVFSVDNGSNIFFGIRNELKKQGLRIDTIDVARHSQFYIYCDFPYPWQLSQLVLLFRNRKKNILFCFESPLVNPFSHQKILQSFFTKIYTWDNSVIDNVRYFKFLIPQQIKGLITKKVAFKNKRFLTLINSNKQFPWLFKMISPFKTDLYEERVKVLNYLDEQKYELDLYGFGWNKPRKFSIKDRIFGYKKYASYKGPAIDKYSILSKYKFSICFENCIAPGYITEKIIDCFKARCVPVYLGAPDIEKYFDKTAFIDFRKFNGDYDRLFEYLSKMTEEDYEDRMEAIEKILKSKSFIESWFEEGFKKSISESISSMKPENIYNTNT